MGTEVKDPLELLQIAVDMEREGRQFYLDAADRTHDTVVKAILLSLAADEEAHERDIRRYFAAVTDGKSWQDPEYDSRPADEVHQRVREMTDRAMSRFVPEAGMLDVYEMARDAEITGRDFYIELSKQIEDPLMARFFGFLSSIEEVHRSVLDLFITAAGKV